MRRAQAPTGFAVIILVEQQQVLPVRIVLERAVGRECRNMAVFVTMKNVGYPLCQQATSPGRDVRYECG